MTVDARAAFVGVVALTLAPTSPLRCRWSGGTGIRPPIWPSRCCRSTTSVGATRRCPAPTRVTAGITPGPLLPWLLAPFDWLFGTTGILVGVAVLNSAAIVGALVLARRRGGFTLTVLVAVVLLVLTLANGRTCSSTRGTRGLPYSRSSPTCCWRGRWLTATSPCCRGWSASGATSSRPTSVTRRSCSGPAASPR